jgi:putative tricarboxylic transport membrane protein
MERRTAGAADGKTDKIACRLSSLDLALGLVVLAAAGFYLWEAFKLPPPLSASDIGAGRFPSIVGIAVLLLAAPLTLHAVITRSRRAAGASDRRVTVNRPVAVALAMVMTVLLAVSFPMLGAYATSILIVGSLMLISGERRWWLLLTIPVLSAVLIYLCFGLLLNVQFP